MPRLSRRMASNRWQLYISIMGWQQCEDRLEQALAASLKALNDYADAAEVNTATLREAGLVAHAVMSKEMSDPRNAAFGTLDAEPLEYMRIRIQNHLRKRYGVDIEL
jgi:hypothetical protein